MFWYIVLTIVCAVFVVIAFAAIVLFILSGCEEPIILVPFVIALVIAIAAGTKTTEIERKNTVTTVETVQAEITDKEIDNDDNILRYYIATDYGIMSVSEEEYVKFSNYDYIIIDVKTDIKFGEKQTPTISIAETV